MKYNFMDEELKMRFPFNGNFESIANKINYSVKNVKSPNNIYVKRIMVGICSIFVLLITGTVVLPSIINNGFIVQFWEDKTIVQKYPSFTYSNIRYTIFSTQIKEGINTKYVGNKVDDIIVDGIDVYNAYKDGGALAAARKLNDKTRSYKGAPYKGIPPPPKANPRLSQAILDQLPQSSPKDHW